MRQVIDFCSGVDLVSEHPQMRVSKPQLLGFGDILGGRDELLELPSVTSVIPSQQGLESVTRCCGTSCSMSVSWSGVRFPSSANFRAAACCWGVLPIRNSPGGISTNFMPIELVV